MKITRNRTKPDSPKKDTCYHFWVWCTLDYKDTSMLIVPIIHSQKFKWLSTHKYVIKCKCEVCWEYIWTESWECVYWLKILDRHSII